MVIGSDRYWELHVSDRPDRLGTPKGSTILGLRTAKIADHLVSFLWMAFSLANAT
jgi:hypothetical protein